MLGNLWGLSISEKTFDFHGRFFFFVPHPMKAAWYVFLLSVGALSSLQAAPLTLRVVDETGAVTPCRVHLRGADDKPVKPQELPSWFDHFVCSGDAKLELPPGSYHYEIERGPEEESKRGELQLPAEGAKLEVQVRRMVDLAKEGWWSGETHIHRPAGLGNRIFSVDALKSEIALHLRAEDLHIGPVITWWNSRNLWANTEPPAQLLQSVDGNRFYRVMAGEDERGGGALLYFNLSKPMTLPDGKTPKGMPHPEYPSAMVFLQMAKKQAGVYVDVEKPFWSDAPMWFASGLVDSVGIANNHMNRSGVRDEEAWGHLRDRGKYPPPLGNGYWTQQIYYHLLNTGVRLPPSAGSASGVLPNPVGYNRVYVHLDGALTWDKWWDGLRAGQVFVTNGPLLRVRANGEWPGHVFQGRQGQPLTVKLEAQLDGRDLMSQIEIIQNGEVVRKVPVAEFRRTGSLGELSFSQSGWFLVRVITDVPDTFRFASTGPFYVEIGSQPRRISRKSAQFFVDWLQDRMASMNLTDPTQREEVLSYLRTAEAWWRKKVSDANAE